MTDAIPTAFLCHAPEDKPVVGSLALELTAAGIRTFYDEWELRSGDSLRRKIEAGIESCTHFIVILSPISLTKEWVNTELDAGLVKRIERGCRLIPLRLGLQVRQIPWLLRGTFSPSLDDYDVGVKEIISDILGLTRRPPLGSLPAHAEPARAAGSGLSVAAGRIAAHFVEVSEKGREGDPALSVDELRALTAVSDDDLLEAVDELEARGWATRSTALAPLGFVRLSAHPAVFAALDAQFKEWNPEADAKVIAAELVNGPGQAVLCVLAEQLGWTPRRMNAAIAYLDGRGLIYHSSTPDYDFEHFSVMKSVLTRRFLRDG
jgi:hypothetical protein